MSCRARLWIALALVAGVFGVPLAAAQGTPAVPSSSMSTAARVEVSGRVLHADTRRPVSGVSVLALQMRSGGSPAEASARTGPDGRFRFRLDPQGNPPTIFQAIYREVAYTSGPHRFGDRRAFATDIVVHETTADSRGVFIGDRAILVEQNVPGVIEVREVVALGNASTRTYVGTQAAPGGARTTFRLPLPNGAAQVDIRQGLAPSGQGADGAVLDTIPVTPGIRQVVLTYRLPATSSEIDVRLTTGWPTLALHVFAALPLRVTSEHLPTREERLVDGRAVQRLSGRHLSAASIVIVRLSGVAVRSMPNAAIPAIAMMIAAVVLAAAWPWVRRRRGDASGSGPA